MSMMSILDEQKHTKVTSKEEQKKTSTAGLGFDADFP